VEPDGGEALIGNFKMVKKELEWIGYNPAMSSLGYVQLVKTNKNFRSLWCGQIVSELGDWFNNVAVLGLVLHLTGSGLVVTAILLCRTVPSAVFGPFAGVFTDRLSRRTLLLGSDYIRALLALGFLVVNSQQRVWMAYVFSALLTAVSIFFSTAKTAAIPELCETNQLTTANALTGSTTAVLQMAGGAVGGFATQWFGYNIAFLLNAFSFLGSAAFILSVKFQERASRRSPTDTHPQTSFFKEFHDGVLYIWRNAVVLGLVLIGVGWATGGGAAQILFTVFAVDIYHAGDAGIGLLYSAGGLGIMIGATIANFYFRHMTFVVTKWVIGICMALTGVFYSIFSFTHLLSTGFFWIAVSRVTMGITHIIATTLLMNIVPSEFRGRTFSTKDSLVIFTMVLSMLLAGVGEHYVGIRAIALIAGILTFLTGAVWLIANWAGVYQETVVEAELPLRQQ
jgi:MFS family permease